MNDYAYKELIIKAKSTVCLLRKNTFFCFAIKNVYFLCDSVLYERRLFNRLLDALLCFGSGLMCYNVCIVTAPPANRDCQFGPMVCARGKPKCLDLTRNKPHTVKRHHTLFAGTNTINTGRTANPF